MAFFPIIYLLKYQQLTCLLQMHPFDFPSKNYPAPGQQDKAYALGQSDPALLDLASEVSLAHLRFSCPI